jgi:pyroglutamyl-peptidase
MKSVLLTGFEPFGGETINPSQLAVTNLDGCEMADHKIVARTLPCVFGAALDELRGYLKEFQPELVVCVGQAGGRAEISLERVAINVDDAPIPDNCGQIPLDSAVVEGAPAAYFSSLPIKSIVAALKSEGIAASVSNSAGTFVCNHVFYGLMHELRGSTARGGFIHVPFCVEQVEDAEKSPTMSLETIEKALLVAVEVALALTGE